MPIERRDGSFDFAKLIQARPIGRQRIQPYASNTSAMHFFQLCTGGRVVYYSNATRTRPQRSQRVEHATVIDAINAWLHQDAALNAESRQHCLIVVYGRIGGSVIGTWCQGVGVAAAKDMCMAVTDWKRFV